jgi:hypothetical protein
MEILPFHWIVKSELYGSNLFGVYAFHSLPAFIYSGWYHAPVLIFFWWVSIPFVINNYYSDNETN